MIGEPGNPPHRRRREDGGRPCHRFAHEAMACTFELLIVGDEADYAEHAARAAFDEVDRMEQELSRFVDHSDVARINQSACGQAVKVGPETFECLELAAAVHGGTRGAFDVTAAGDARPDRPIGMQLLELDTNDHTVIRKADGLSIDLGGIGKGYAVDRIAELLREWSVESALVQSGQSTALSLGTGAAGGVWLVQLRQPGCVERSVGTVGLCDEALSGSGRFHHGAHIIDPRTGQPAESALGAWAKAPSAALADALSTAFMVMSFSEVEAYCGAQSEVSAALALPTDGDFEIVRVGAGFEMTEASSS